VCSDARGIKGLQETLPTDCQRHARHQYCSCEEGCQQQGIPPTSRTQGALSYHSSEEEDDECYVQLDDSNGRVFITRCADEEYDENCDIPNFKQSLVKVMVWGCFM
jgi:hypothetical protein